MSQLIELGTQSGAPVGDVVGPAISTDNAVVRFDGVTGKLIQNSVVIITDAGAVSGVTSLSAQSASLSSLTANRMVMTGAAGALQAPSDLTNGQIFIGRTGNQPAAGAITSTDGSITVTLGSGTIDLSTSGMLSGTGQTIGAVTADIITIPLGAIPATFSLEVNVGAFEPTTPASSGTKIIGTVRTSGIAATLVGTPDITVNEDAALIASVVDIVVSANNAIVQVTGVGGLTVDWGAKCFFVKVV